METLRNTSLGKMFTNLQEQHRRKLDLVIPSDHIKMGEGLIELRNVDQFMQTEDLDRLLQNMGIDASNIVQFEPSDNAESQISEKLKIPRRFYRYLKDDHLDLLDYNVSQLFNRADNNYFIRSFKGSNGDGGILRALLSDQYKVIDHMDVLGTTLEVIQNMGVEVQIGRCNLTLDNMYIEVISKDVIEHADDLLNRYRSPKGNDRDGDNRVFAGFIISNSETGRGRYRVQPRAMIGKCDNGLIFKEDALAATHLGSKMESGIKWSADTMATEVDLIQKQTRDAVTTFLSREYLGRKIKYLEGFTQKLERPIEAINNVCKSLNFSEDRVEGVVTFFVQGGDDSSLGVVNALTAYAQEVEDPDMQYEVEEQSVAMLPKIAEYAYN